MPTKLDQLLESIAPNRTVLDTARRADAAINSFRVPTGQIADIDSFRSVMLQFIPHVEKCILQLTSTPRCDPGFYWDRCAQMLRNTFGDRGVLVAFDRTRTGIDGGLYGVLKAVAQQLAEHYGSNWIRCRVAAYWHSLSVQEQLAAGMEYLQKYRNLLPRELTEEGGFRVRANLVKVLEKHPYMIGQLQQVRP